MMAPARINLLGLSGPSAAGKSTLARRAAQSCEHVIAVKQDDYYKDRILFAKHGEFVDWENDANFCWEELAESLDLLKRGMTADVPEYDKRMGKRTGCQSVAPRRLVIVEGFLILSRPEIRRLLDASVYLHVPTGLQWARRLHRDPGMSRVYFDQIVVPSYHAHARTAGCFADRVVDASGLPDATWNLFQTAIMQLVEAGKLAS